MRLRGDRGDYIADGARHEISQIQRRREGSLVVADFSWKNVAGASGKGQWLVSVDGAFIAGQWRQDGVEEGPWSWYGRRKPSLGNPLPPELARSSAQEEAVPVPDLGPSIIQAARELVATYRDKEPLAKERLAKAWEDAAPQQPSGTGGDLAPSAVLRRRWLAAGEELRSCLGLSVQGLTPKWLQDLGQAATIALLFLLSLFFARALNLALGNPADAATWSLFAAAYAVILDLVLPSRKGLLGSAVLEDPVRQQRLRTLRSWEERPWSVAKVVWGMGRYLGREKWKSLAGSDCGMMKNVDALFFFGAVQHNTHI
ncbi:unnamed protein product [Durusdinium trenchii]|uniref:Uncharacterized protein n=1 Tax=Durusdinium trenchii TaxID=1381693 RepID=A0ABP0N4Z7_9DINO